MHLQAGARERAAAAGGPGDGRDLRSVSREVRASVAREFEAAAKGLQELAAKDEPVAQQKDKLVLHSFKCSLTDSVLCSGSSR